MGHKSIRYEKKKATLISPGQALERGDSRNTQVKILCTPMEYLGLEMRMFILLEISIRQQFLNASTKITKRAQNVGVIQP